MASTISPGQNRANSGQPTGANKHPIDADGLYKKVFWRFVPSVMLCYVIAYLDRVNIGFAKLQMSVDLGFSETVFGLGAGIFFLGYFLFELPGNLIMNRVGAKLVNK